jgi:hypothetical protein
MSHLTVQLWFGSGRTATGECVSLAGTDCLYRVIPAEEPFPSLGIDCSSAVTAIAFLQRVYEFRQLLIDNRQLSFRRLSHSLLDCSEVLQVRREADLRF